VVRGETTYCVKTRWKRISWMCSKKHLFSERVHYFPHKQILGIYRPNQVVIVFFFAFLPILRLICRRCNRFSRDAKVKIYRNVFKRELVTKICQTRREKFSIFPNIYRRLYSKRFFTLII
jgi:hypothetical protein